MRKLEKKHFYILYILVVAGGIGVAGALVLGFGTFRRTPMPDPAAADPKQVSNYLASDSFGKLSSEQKMNYLERLHQRSDFRGPPQGLTEAQQEKIRQNIGPVFHQRMEKEMEAFAKMSPAQQTAFLDKRIDEMETFRKKMKSGGSAGGPGFGPGPGGPPPGGPGGPPPGGRRGGPPSRAMMQGMISHTNPRQRALMTKFHEAMEKRMKERGIAGPP